LTRLRDKPICRFIPVLFLLLISTLDSCLWKDNSTTHPLPYSEKVANYFKQSLLRFDGLFSGGVLVAKGGNILFEHYAGYADYPTKLIPLQEDTPLHIASTSKTFTAIAVLQLIEQQKLSLEDSLSSFFEKWSYPGITIKQLLTHRSGLPNYVYFMDANPPQQHSYTNQEVISWMIEHRPPIHARPDTRFEYCNTNYLILASLIEKVSGYSYPEFLRRSIFNFLGMKNTFVFQVADTTRATPSFANANRPWVWDYLDYTYGDKNIYSTPRDLLKWDQALYTQQLVSDSLLSLAFTPYSFERPGQNNYGLGFRLKLLPNQKKIIYHFGLWHGNNAAFARLTDEQVTIIILGNKFNRQIYTAASRSYGLFGPYGGVQLSDEE
jgi:CubicO group peptidase (beta-lactamase class C family)